MFQVTERHYAQGAAVKNAATARVVEMQGGRSEETRPSARVQQKNLDEDRLAQLLAQLAETKKGGAPATWREIVPQSLPRGIWSSAQRWRMVRAT